MEDTIAKCLAKSPDDRFRSMDEVLAALKRVGGGAAPGINATGEFLALTRSQSGPQARIPVVVDAPFLSPTLSELGSFPEPLSVQPESPPSAPPLISQPPPRTGSKGMLVAAIIGALGAAGTLAYVALRPAPAAAPAAASLPAPTQAASSTPSAAPAPAVALVKVRINSEPDGASVKEDGVELCSSTPCDILYKGSDADPAREHKLTVAKTGYRSESRSVKVADTPVLVKLAKVEVPRFIPQAPPRTDTPVVPGYKTDIPY
jgi:serine/threonine-protein kinase